MYEACYLYIFVCLVVFLFWFLGTGKVLPIIHNYGHGGSGVCLSWGCATEVCDIVQKIIDEE